MAGRAAAPAASVLQLFVEVVRGTARLPGHCREVSLDGRVGFAELQTFAALQDTDAALGDARVLFVSETVWVRHADQG
ncbi:hypothetical protein AAW51_3373 [Caldimonas brevitalea]|uniref:Uncharacterized protein n=1 Tax=Caldimonas brevitalea TaxID=413882 RepID=A0A0G3BKT1_9BURK|nr:hypothetical protein AAW51_3373 [Caldimonas brevitalea]